MTDDENDELVRHLSTLLVVTMTKAFIAGALLAIVLFVGALAFAGKVKAHSWYDKECCDVRDCEPLSPDRVKVTPEGYVTPDGQLVPFGQARVSADKDFHWCKYQKDSTKVIHPHEKRMCFYAPAGGM